MYVSLALVCLFHTVCEFTATLLPHNKEKRNPTIPPDLLVCVGHKVHDSSTLPVHRHLFTLCQSCQQLKQEQVQSITPRYQRGLQSVHQVAIESQERNVNEVSN